MLNKRKKEFVRCILTIGMSAMMLLASCIYAYAANEVENDVNCLPAVRQETTSAEAKPIAGNAPAVTGQAVSGGVSVNIDGKPYGGVAFIDSSITYVGIREFSMKAGAYSVSWDTKTRTAYVLAEGLSISLKYGSGYMEANGRYFWLGDTVIIRDGTMFVPIRIISRAFGYSVDWIGATKTVALTKGSGPIASGTLFYDGDCVLWLSRIIHAEANGEPLRGKVAVGNVVLNRVRSDQYPNTIYSVIFDKKNGIQFTPVSNGTIYCNPGSDSIIAAKLCLDGAVVCDNALFFVNEAIAQNSWVSDNRQYVMTVGNHKFFA